MKSFVISFEGAFRVTAFICKVSEYQWTFFKDAPSTRVGPLNYTSAGPRQSKSYGPANSFRQRMEQITQSWFFHGVGFTLQKLGVDKVKGGLVIKVGESGVAIGAAEYGNILTVIEHDVFVVPNLVPYEIERTVVVSPEQVDPVAKPTFITMVHPALTWQRGGEHDDGRKARQIGDETRRAAGREMFSYFDTDG